MATVRYKIMDAPNRSDEVSGSVALLELDSSKFTSKVEVLSISKKPREIGIENADVLIVAGRQEKGRLETHSRAGRSAQRRLRLHKTFG